MLFVFLQPYSVNYLNLSDHARDMLTQNRLEIQESLSKHAYQRSMAKGRIHRYTI